MNQMLQMKTQIKISLIQLCVVLVFTGCNSQSNQFKRTEIKPFNGLEEDVSELVQNSSDYFLNDSQFISIGFVDKEFLYSLGDGKVRIANSISKLFIDSVKKETAELYRNLKLESVDDYNLQFYYKSFMNDRRSDIEYFTYDFRTMNGMGVLCDNLNIKGHKKTVIAGYCEKLIKRYSDNSVRIFNLTKDFFSDDIFLALNNDNYHVHWLLYTFESSIHCLIYKSSKKNGSIEKISDFTLFSKEIEKLQHYLKGKTI